MSETNGPFAIGVDIGGTFTAVVCVDAAGHMRLSKIPHDSPQPERRPTSLASPPVDSSMTFGSAGTNWATSGRRDLPLSWAAHDLGVNVKTNQYRAEGDQPGR